MECKNFSSVSTKSKYSILKYICSLSFGYLKQHCCIGITLLTKEITLKNTFYRNEKFNIGMMCLQKGRYGCEVTKLITSLTCNININFPLS